MKNIVLIFLFSLPFLLTAQQEGRALYQTTTKMDTNRLKRVPKEFRDRIPKQFVSEYELFFTQSETYYRFLEKDEEGDGNVSRGGRRFRMGGGGRSNDETYTNLSENRKVEFKEFMDKKFLIKEELAEVKWKITGQKDMIDGRMVMEATTMKDDTINVSAWFTPQIPISTGPSGWQGLPGMIVKLDVNNGQSITMLIEITELDTPEVIKEPTKGKETSQEEYDEMRKKRFEEMKKMRSERGEGGGHSIFIRG